MFFLTTDIEENDYLSRTISHHLYDPDAATRVAQSIVLGVGGGKLLDLLARKTDIYHLNEGHGLPLAFFSTKSTTATWPKCVNAWFSPPTRPSWPATRSAP
ncbi:MAG: hypothetical protein WKG07_28765 [Hymenobacter sp.]